MFSRVAYLPFILYFMHLSLLILASCTVGTGSFLRVKSSRGVTLTPHPFQCRGQEKVELYLYSPYGPYGMYIASVPVQGCTLPYLLLIKGKAVPLKARRGPEVSRKLRFPDFVTTAQNGGEVVSLTHRPPLPPGNAPGTHFCQRLSRPQGHSAIGRIM